MGKQGHCTMLRRFRVSILTLAGETEIINDEAITIKGELAGEGKFFLL
jgi:hypothetical protein